MTDKRKDPRVAVRLKVKIKMGDFEKQFYTANVSRGGLFIECETPLHFEDVFHIELYLSENDVIRCMGKVVWISQPTEKSIYLPGMGLKFEDISLSDREKLGAFLGKIILSEQQVDEDYFYKLEERIILSSEDIYDTNSDAIVVFAGQGIRETVVFTKNIVKSGDGTLKKNYDLYGEELEVGQTLLVPYEGTLKCPYIILTGIPSFFDFNSDENLRNALLGALKMAKEQALPTISIPTFSLLEIGYPLQNIARVSLGTAYGFMKKEVFPKKVFFYCNYHNIQDLLVFQKFKKEIFSN